jgi:hypothetical protein
LQAFPRKECEDRQKACLAEIRGYLEKPFDLKQLEEAIGANPP